jgi:O-antigen/teichoic acid export membrane protein
MKAPPTLAFNTLTSYLRYSLSFLVSFLLIPFMLGKVGSEDFGLWSLLFSVVGFVGLLDCGFAVGVVKISAECRGSGNPEKRNRLLSAILLLYLVLAAATVLLTLLLMPLLPHWLGLGESKTPQALSLLWLLLLRSVVLQLPLSVFKGILFGEQQIVQVNLISAFQNLLYGLFTWLALSNGYSIIACGAASLVAMLIEHLLYVWAAYAYIPHFQLSYQGFQRKELSEIFSFNRHQFLSDVSAIVILQADLIIVKTLYSLHEVALYAIALRLATHGYYLVKQFVNLLAPIVGELKGAGNSHQLGQLTIKSTRLALTVAIPLWLSVLFLGDPLLRFWAGNEMGAAFPVLLALMSAVLIGVPPMVASVILAMSGGHKKTSRAALVGVCTNVGLSYLFAYPLGLVGIAIGTLVTKIVVEYPLVAKELMDREALSINRWVRGAALPLVLPTLLQALTLMTFAWIWDVDTLLSLLLQGGLASTLFFGAIYLRPTAPSELHA